MTPTQQLTFLQERIEDIGSAIFYNLSDAVLKLPSTVVTSLKVDEYGFVWFSVQKPPQHLNEFEQEFPVKMDCYKKGKGYFLQVEGKGFVVTDPEEINMYTSLPDELKDLRNNKVAIVKVKIQKADCFETGTQQKTSWWQTLSSTVMAWFRYRPGTTYYPAS